jgi:hypothetical protein
VDEEVYLDNLTPQAQELAQIAHPRNHSRSNDYTIVCTQPYSTIFHWPVLRDDETGNEYYERCALLVQLGRGLIDSGVSLSRTRTIMSHAENWTRPWTVEEVIRQENR